MPISAYTLSFQNWTVVPHHIEENFRDLRECGFDSVCLSFSESEAQYARRAFELQVKLAHEAGLKVYVVPSRLGGRMAGAPFMPSVWLARHPEAAEPNRSFLPMACLEHQPFRDWIRAFLVQLMKDYPLDGIIWDEPKGVEEASAHPDTRAKLGREPTVEDTWRSYCEMLTELNEACLAVRPELVITLFSQKTDPEGFTQRAAKLPHIQFHGYDGNLARQSFFHEEPTWAKYRIESVWERTVAECELGGKQPFGLVENMLMPSAAIEEYEANLDAYLQGPLPDHLSIYYYAHNNEDPEAVHAITKRLMRKHLA